MSLTVQLPEDVERCLRAKAQAEGKPVEVLAANVLTFLASSLPVADDWLDADFHAECEKDHSPEVTSEEVRRVLSKIPGSMVEDFIAERDE